MRRPGGARSSTMLRPPTRGAATTKKARCTEAALPTLRDLIRSVAALGGFLGQNGDAEPGTQTLWLGLHRFGYIVTIWLARSALSSATQWPVSSKDDSGQRPFL